MTNTIMKGRALGDYTSLRYLRAAFDGKRKYKVTRVCINLPLAKVDPDNDKRFPKHLLLEHCAK